MSVILNQDATCYKRWYIVTKFLVSIQVPYCFVCFLNEENPLPPHLSQFFFVLKIVKSGTKMYREWLTTLVLFNLWQPLLLIKTTLRITYLLCLYKNLHYFFIFTFRPHSNRYSSKEVPICIDAQYHHFSNLPLLFYHLSIFLIIALHVAIRCNPRSTVLLSAWNEPK